MIAGVRAVMAGSIDRLLSSQLRFHPVGEEGELFAHRNSDLEKCSPEVEMGFPL